MNSDPTDVSAARSPGSLPGEEIRVRDPSKRIDEGLGVFRALLLMLIFYLATGSIIWFAWQAWRHWPAR